LKVLDAEEDSSCIAGCGPSSILQHRHTKVITPPQQIDSASAAAAPLVFDSSVFSLGAREADDLDVLTRISETDILMDNTLTGEQKDMLSALLDPLGDDDGGVDLIGEEIVIPDNTFNGLTEVRACVWGGGAVRG
jgi:hypothetical protein